MAGQVREALIAGAPSWTDGGTAHQADGPLDAAGSRTRAPADRHGRACCNGVSGNRRASAFGSTASAPSFPAMPHGVRRCPFAVSRLSDPGRSRDSPNPGQRRGRMKRALVALAGALFSTAAAGCERWIRSALQRHLAYTEHPPPFTFSCYRPAWHRHDDLGHGLLAGSGAQRQQTSRWPTCWKQVMNGTPTT